MKKRSKNHSTSLLTAYSKRGQKYGILHRNMAWVISFEIRYGWQVRRKRETLQLERSRWDKDRKQAQEVHTNP